MRIALPSLITAAMLLGATSAPPARADDGVKVFRCVDAKGHVTLGDSPCPQGSSEQVRTMQRPVDGTPRVVTTPDPAPATAPGAGTPQVMVVHAPQPMYECVAPNGDRYTSDTGDGNLRWVPLWTGGHYRSGRPSGMATSNRVGGQRSDPPPLGGRVGAPAPERPPIQPPGGHRPRPPHLHPGYAVGGTWVRDSCHALPPAEVCARVRDRRDDIRRRFFNAQESERNELRREERGLNARLSADCGIG